MMQTMRRAFGLILVATIMNPLSSLANEGLEEPQIHLLCNQESEKKEIKNEMVWHKWPDGSIKSKSVYFVDGTWVEYHFHQNGQMKLEAYSTRMPVEGRPKTTINGKHGTQKRWHENGQLSSCSVFKMGKAVGTKIIYRKDGTPAASWTYEDGIEVEHLTYSKVFGWQHFKK
jgi:antitoxin component YwqK of YwqJK toxin-antitoxin module